MAAANARLSEAGQAAVEGRARSRRGRRNRLYIGAVWRKNNNKGEEHARRMKASTCLRFTIAVCALGVRVAAVDGIVACLAVLLLL